MAQDSEALQVLACFTHLFNLLLHNFLAILQHNPMIYCQNYRNQLGCLGFYKYLPIGKQERIYGQRHLGRQAKIPGFMVLFMR